MRINRKPDESEFFHQKGQLNSIHSHLPPITKASNCLFSHTSRDVNSESIHEKWSQPLKRIRANDFEENCSPQEGRLHRNKWNLLSKVAGERENWRRFYGYSNCKVIFYTTRVTMFFKPVSSLNWTNQKLKVFKTKTSCWVVYVQRRYSKSENNLKRK